MLEIVSERGDINNMITTGHLKQKADPYVVLFVFGCIIITVVLLFAMQSAETAKAKLNSGSDFTEYLD